MSEHDEKGGREMSLDIRVIQEVDAELRRLGLHSRRAAMRFLWDRLIEHRPEWLVEDDKGKE